MVILCDIEWVTLFYQCMNFFAILLSLLLLMVHYFFCYLFLLFIGAEYGRYILGTDILALTIWLSWVVDMHENCQKSFIGYYFWVEHYFNDLDVPSCACFHLFVGRLLFLASDVPWGYFMHSFESLDHGLDTPETATAQYRSLHKYILFYLYA